MLQHPQFGIGYRVEMFFICISKLILESTYKLNTCCREEYIYLFSGLYNTRGNIVFFLKKFLFVLAAKIMCPYYVKNIAILL